MAAQREQEEGTLFNDEDAVSKLEALVFNSLSLGQWESARGHLISLSSHEKGRKTVKEILRSIVLNPKAVWSESKSIPSENHLVLLALQAHAELCQDDVEGIPSAVQRQHEFKLLLHSCTLCEGYTTQISEWLYGYYTTHCVGSTPHSLTPLHTFHATIQKFLLSVLQSNPSVAHVLISYLTVANRPHYLTNNELLQLLYIDCIDSYLGRLEKVCRKASTTEDPNLHKDVAELSNKIHSILSLVDPLPDMGRFFKRLDSTLVKLIQLDFKNSKKEGLFTFSSLYSCFVGRSSPMLIQRLQDIEEYLKGHSGGQVEEEVAKEYSSNEERWESELYKTLRSNHHFLERIMDAGLKAISSGSTDRLADIFSDPMLTCIKPLLLLLGWDRYPDVGSGQKLLDVLWPEAQKAEPLLLSGCCKLAFQVGLVQWCLQKARPFLPVSPTPMTSSAGDVFQGLKNHSILYVLHHSTPLSSLDPYEVIDILKLRPDSSLNLPAMSPPFDIIMSPKQHSSSSTSLQPEQERDINTFRGFCSLKLIMEAVWYSILLSNGIQTFVSTGTTGEPKKEAGDGVLARPKSKVSRKLDLGQSDELSAGDDLVSSLSSTSNTSLYATEVTRRLEEAKSHLSAVFPLNFRLEVLENIFSLLFLVSDDIQSPEEGGSDHEATDPTSSIHSTSSPDNSGFSYSNSIAFIRKQHGFLLDERTSRDILLLLNDSIFELSAAKFSLLSSPGKPMGSALPPGKEILSSIPPALLQQRFGKLQKDIYEAKWRLELVSSKTGLSSLSSSTLSSPESISSYESLSDTSEQEDDIEEHKKEPDLIRKGRPHDLFNEAGKRPTTPFKPSFPLLAKEGSQIPRKTDEASPKKPTERYIRKSPSADEIYESSGHCADVEEGSPMPLAKKKKIRSHSGSEFKIRKIKSQPVQKGTGIICQMLASPKSLLCKCLRHGNYLKAHEVVKMFGMENEIGDSLVKFSEQLKEVRQELVSRTQISSLPSAAVTPQKQVVVNGSSGLQVAILNATDCSSTLDSLNRLVLPTVLHKMLFAGNEDLDHSHKEMPLLNSLEENVPSLVILDLLISSKIDGHTSKKIVNMAVEKSSVVLDCFSPKLSDNLVGGGRRSFQERRSASLLDKPLQGPLSLLHTLSEVSGYFLLSIPLAAPFPLSCQPIVSPHCLLTQFLYPIRVDLIQSWRDFSESYGEKRESVESVIAKSCIDTDILDVLSKKESAKGINPVFNELSIAMRSLPQDGDTPKAEGGEPSVQYLLHVSGYLSKLVHLLRNSLGLSSAQVSPSQMLSVLRESPTDLIGKLVFEKNINPERLEQFMTDLPHLKIVEVIVKCCCPHIPNDSQRLSSYPLMNECIYPLNVINGEESVSPNGNGSEDENDPCLLSHKLLGKMTTTLKGLCQTDGGKILALDLRNAYKMTEMKKVLSCTSKLASISLSSLKNEPNRQIAFFCNVTNLLYCHAIMYIISVSDDISATGLSLASLESDKLAKIAYFSRVGYVIGELGLVSLYDLHYSLLRQNLSLPVLDKERKVKLQPLKTIYEPWKEYAPSQPDPRVLYVIGTGSLSSPPPRLMQVEHLHSDLESAEIKFLRATVSLDVQKSTVRIPKLLDDHRNDFISRKSRFEPDNPYRHLSNIALLKYIKGKLLKEQEEQIGQILDLYESTSKRSKASHDLKIEVIDEDYTLGYDFPRRGDGQSPLLPRSHSPGKKNRRLYSKIKHYTFTHETMYFVQSQAPLLASLVYLLCPPENMDDIGILNESSLTESIIPKEEKEQGESSLVQSFMPRKAKIRQIPEVKRSLSLTDDKNPVGSFLGWETTLEKILSLFRASSPLKKFLATRLVCFKGLLSWDKSAQECPDDQQEDDKSINLRKLSMLPGDSSDISQACSFVLRKLLRHGLISEGIAFLRNEPLICNSVVMQTVTDLVCSAGLVHETKERESISQEAIDQPVLVDPLILIYLHSNKEFATRLVLSSLEIWPVSYCVNILMYINYHLPPTSQLSAIVSKKLKQLYVYEKIIETVEVHNGQCSWGHWSHLSYDSNEKKDSILKLLLKLKEFTLAREWNRVHHNSDDIIMQIEEQYIYELLEGMEEPDRYTAQSTLEDLPSNAMKQQVCENLLVKCFNLESLILILRFLLDKLSFQIQSAEKLKNLNNQLLGVKALLCLPHFVQEQYRSLMKRPLFIVEQLLIDLKIEWAGLVIKELNEDEYICQMDTDDLPPLKYQTHTPEEPLNPFTLLIMFYAEKALEFPLPSSREYPSRATSPSVPSTPFSRYDRMRSPSESPSIPPTPRHKKGRTSSFSTVFPPSDRPKYSRFEPPPHPPKREDWKTSNYCELCNSSLFGMFSKRHHCRRCGRMVCAQCSPHFMIVEGYGSQQKVCNDCYEYNFITSTTSDDPQLSDKEDDIVTPTQYPWQLLPGDPHYNENLRTEFCYEESPSTTLCMVILDLLSDAKACAGFILHCCHNVSMQLVADDSGRVNEEIDHYFTINIMETMLLNAKLKLFHAGDSHGVELCDTYLSRVDLLRLLISSSCSEIPSIQELTKPDLARRVRDRLVAEDRFELAMEVSTKCQLDSNTVWTAWGMGCIKAGEFQMARDKFRHCFHGGTQLSGGAFLIERIVEQILSCPLASMKNSDDWNDSMRLLVEHKQDSSFITDRKYEECLFYLKNYGTAAAMIGFLARHHYWKDACQQAYTKHCSNDVFVDQIWLPALKCGQLDNLEEALTRIDPSLSVWEQYLTGVCRFLSQRKLFHVLYRIQLFMRDFVRAAMTCIKFFIGFSGHKTTLSDLYGRKHYLETARNHFRTAIDARVKRSASFSTTELEGHMRTISLQMRVIDQLHKAAATNNILNKPVPVTSMGDSGVQPSTLFGNGAVRGEVAAHLLISCQESPEAVFQIASDIISAYRLPSSKVFTEVSKQLAMKENYVGIRVLVQSIQKSHLMSPELNDEVCMAAIKVLATQTKEARTLDKHLDKLVSMLIKDENKVNCLIQCGKLKNAYLVAIKAKLPEEVERIADAAARAGQTSVRDICEKWLRTRS